MATTRAPRRTRVRAARLPREHDLNLWRAFGVFLQGWVASQSGAPADGLEDMRRGAALLREQNALLYDGLLKVALAGAEAGAGDLDRAGAILDEALSTCHLTGYRAFEAELHRARGELLLKQNPANSAPAEEAFLTAIAVAKRQGTHSFELRAALSLAKLYQSTARFTEAHTFLAPALDGAAAFGGNAEIWPRRKVLLTALAATDELRGGGRASAATDAVALFRYGGAALCRRAAMARRRRQKPSPDSGGGGASDK